MEKLIDSYLNRESWLVRENANIDYSLQGLNLRVIEDVVSNYWLNQIYPSDVAKGHISGDYHIHNLGVLSAYCFGHDIFDLLMGGFSGSLGKITSKPPKHFRTALGQAYNFLYTLQGEAAGAISFSNFDTFLSPFIRSDKLSREEIKQALQEFLFNMNVSTRTGAQSPFSNLTFDLVVPDFLKDQAAIINGKSSDLTLGDCQDEVEIFNRIYNELMFEGDGAGRIFSFPIITYNLTKDFNWDQKDLFSLVSKFGSPYFSNYISTGLDPSDSRSMCCLSHDTQIIHRGQRGISKTSIGDFGNISSMDVFEMPLCPL